MSTREAGRAADAAGSAASPVPPRIVTAAALGTAFEWYDFYLYVALAPVIAARFFAGVDAQEAYVFALLAFASGFLVRPFGALAFGRLGDMIGRKHTFLLTIVVMGMSTFAIGMLPDAEAVGIAAPVMLVGLRLLQGLALGGEYGGAVLFVAEHAPPGRRGAATGWIQMTATLGLAFALLAVWAVRELLPPASVEQWGWRIPFIASLALLALSIWVRLGVAETPVFRRLLVAGAISSGPLGEAFGRWRNLRRVLIVLLGLTAAQAAVWYTAHWMALQFLTQSLLVEPGIASVLVAAALLLGAPLFLVAGALSDRVGRKPVFLAGCVLAVLAVGPLFGAVASAAHPALVQAQQQTAVQLVVDPADCSSLFDPTGLARPVSGCDVARRLLVERAVRFTVFEAPAGTKAVLRIGAHWIPSPALRGAPPLALQRQQERFREAVGAALAEAGYPATADPERIDRPDVIAALLLLVGCAALVYGPLAALLAETFPPRIRYTAMSVPYHLANGWIGGLLPALSVALVARHGDPFAGLWPAAAIAGFGAVVTLLFVRETRHDVFERD